MLARSHTRQKTYSGVRASADEAAAASESHLKAAIVRADDDRTLPANKDEGGLIYRVRGWCNQGRR